MRFFPNSFRPHALVVGFFLFGALAFHGSVAEAQPWKPSGSDFQINSETTDSQVLPTVTRAADGRSVVAWTTIGPPPAGSDLPDFQVVARGFDADGTPFGPDIVASTSRGATPHLAASPSGDFLLVWYSLEVTAEDAFIDVVGRKLDSSGQPDGVEVTINEETDGLQFFARADAASDGTFVVAWQSTAPSTTGYDVRARFVDAVGQPSGSEFAANTLTTGDQTHPDVAVASGGAPDEGFLVVWQSSQSNGTDASGTSIHGRLFDSAGVALGDDFQINTQTTGDQTRPRATALEDGKYAVVWQSADQAPERITGQVLDSAGSFVGGELTVPSGTAPQVRPDVASAPGGFLVAWEILDGNGDGESIFAQGFDLQGAADGAAFQVNSFRPLNQTYATRSAGGGRRRRLSGGLAECGLARGR